MRPIRKFRSSVISETDPADYVEEMSEIVVMHMDVDQLGGVPFEVIDVPKGRYNTLMGIQPDASFEGLIEIYTPRKTEEDVEWREIGVEHAIIDPHTANRRHAGDTDQVVGVSPALIDIDNGDVWVRPRRMRTAFSDSNLNLFYFIFTHWVEDRSGS